MDFKTTLNLPAGISKLYEPMLTTKQAAQFLGVSPHFLYKDRTMTKKHVTPLIPYVKVGGAVRYRLSDLQTFLQQNRVAGSVETNPSATN